jgi:hypothetical protein
MVPSNKGQLNHECCLEKGMPNAKIYSEYSSEPLVDIIADLDSARYGRINGLFTFSYRQLIP